MLQSFTLASHLDQLTSKTNFALDYNTTFVLGTRKALHFFTGKMPGFRGGQGYAIGGSQFVTRSRALRTGGASDFLVKQERVVDWRNSVPHPIPCFCFEKHHQYHPDQQFHVLLVGMRNQYKKAVQYPHFGVRAPLPFPHIFPTFSPHFSESRISSFSISTTDIAR